MNETNSDIYFVPAAPTRIEIKVRGSKFIAGIFGVDSRERAESIYSEVKQKYYDATHNCYAYRIDSNIFRYSDDGEPNGTAGKPILQVIDNRGIIETLCVVTRYFGGVKLGTGGLIRAYSAAAKEAVGRLEIKKKIRGKRIRLIFNYDLENGVRKLLNQYRGKLENSDYSDQINMHVLIPESKSDSFVHELIELSNDTIKIKVP